MRAYARANNIVILAFIKESFSHKLIAVSIQECANYNGDPYYTFGRLYHIFSNDCVYNRCGCASFNDEMEARKHAYQFFGIK